MNKLLWSMLFTLRIMVQKYSPQKRKWWLNQISLILLDCPHQVLLLYNSVTELQVK